MQRAQRKETTKYKLTEIEKEDNYKKTENF
jgi:hypothetical protein